MCNRLAIAEYNRVKIFRIVYGRFLYRMKVRVRPGERLLRADAIPSGGVNIADAAEYLRAVHLLLVSDEFQKFCARSVVFLERTQHN